ncbi:MFS transporter [Microbacterium sp. MPKO10]|uniref:MFS transporter n=1 Tax=Microbacterium sp. MPKO10 TaxID=2989818 RepID=UPI0022367A14|nr:MFS transporter [Microbacterium sp. MPKO10]MCW4457162.1 MFS transporter [Microbacterium sp. MPKO10]
MTVTTSRSETVAWRNAIFVIFTMAGLSMATWAARVPTIKANLEITTGSVGLLVLCMSACSVVGLILAPMMFARLGPRRSMLASMLLVAVGLVVIGLGAAVFYTPAVVGVGLGLFGFGNGSCDVVMNVEAADVEKHLKRTVMPLMHAFFSGGTVVGAGIAALTELFNVSMLVHAVFMAVLIAVTTLIAVRFVPARTTTETQELKRQNTSWRQKVRDSLAVWADPRLLAIGLIILGMAFAEGSANDWVALAVVDGHGMLESSGAAILAVFLTAMTVGRVIGGPFLDRFGRVRVLIGCGVSAVLGLLLFIIAPSLPLLVVGAVLWGLGASLGFPVGMSAAADSPKDAAARVSAVAIIGYCAFLVGPPLIGLLADHIGLLNALFVVLGLIAIAGIASPAARERSVRIEPTD